VLSPNPSLVVLVEPHRPQQARCAAGRIIADNTARRAGVAVYASHARPRGPHCFPCSGDVSSVLQLVGMPDFDDETFAKVEVREAWRSNGHVRSGFYPVSLTGAQRGRLPDR